MSQSRPVISSARAIAVSTFISRITGLIRDMLLAQTYGLIGVFDAFNYGFQFPNLFRRLFGEGALAAAFVPVFTRTLDNQGRPAAWRLLARAAALLTVVALGVIGVLWLILMAVWLFGPSGDPDELAARHLLLALTALMLPFMLTICLVALLASALNCVGSFTPAALMPVVLNICMILGILVLGPLLGQRREQQIFGVAISVLVAGVLQLAILAPVLRRNGIRLGWKLDTRDPNVRKVLGLMLPVLIGQGVLILGPFLDTQICWLFSRIQGGSATATWFGITFDYPLREGALSALANAQRLYQFPLGVLAISLAVAALPTFTRLANRQDWTGWAEELTRTLRVALFIGLLTGSMMVVWSEPIVRLLFEYRRFDAEDTRRVAHVMFFYGFGLWAFCAQHIVVRGFYSLGDVRTPLYMSCVLLPANLALSLVLIWSPAIREAAFAISSAITSSITVVVGLVLLQRRTAAQLCTPGLGLAAARMLIAVAIGAGLLRFAGYEWLIPAAGSIQPEWLARGLVTLGGLALGSLACCAGALLLRLPEPLLMVRRARSPGSLAG
jgi:putative peptidoglycan lipid II flippase